MTKKKQNKNKKRKTKKKRKKNPSHSEKLLHIGWSWRPTIQLELSCILWCSSHWSAGSES